MANWNLRMVRVGVTALSLLCLAGCDQGTAPAVEPPGAEAPVTEPLNLADAVVIGASVSAGFETYVDELPPEVAGAANLAKVLGAITGGGDPASEASIMFFMRPDSIAESQLEAALAAEADIVFAIDYLFWHAYGGGLTPERRLALLEKGLARLDRLGDTRPVVIADLPDMTHAVEAGILGSFQVPSLESQAALNARLRAWASTREHVLVVPLRDVVSTAMASGTVELGGRSYSGASARGLLTANGLHATVSGLIAISLEALERLRSSGLIGSSSVWEQDPGEVRSALVERLGEEG